MSKPSPKICRLELHKDNAAIPVFKLNDIIRKQGVSFSELAKDAEEAIITSQAQKFCVTGSIDAAGKKLTIISKGDLMIDSLIVQGATEIFVGAKGSLIVTYSLFNVMPQHIQQETTALEMPGSVFTRFARITILDLPSEKKSGDKLSLGSVVSMESAPLVWSALCDESYDDYYDSSVEIMRIKYSTPSDLWHKVQPYRSGESQSKMPSGEILTGVTAATPDAYRGLLNSLKLHIINGNAAAAAATPDAISSEPELASAAIPDDAVEFSGAAAAVVSEDLS